MQAINQDQNTASLIIDDIGNLQKKQKLQLIKIQNGYYGKIALI